MGEKLFTSIDTSKSDDWVAGYWSIVDDYWQKKEKDMQKRIYNRGGIVSSYNYPKVKKIIYNFKNPDKPATIVFWSDLTKTVVKCDANDFSEEAGLAQCFLKKCLGCSRKDIKKLIENADVHE